MTAKSSTSPATTSGKRPSRATPTRRSRSLSKDPELLEDPMEPDASLPDDSSPDPAAEESSPPRKPRRRKSPPAEQEAAEPGAEPSTDPADPEAKPKRRIAPKRRKLAEPEGREIADQPRTSVEEPSPDELENWNFDEIPEPQEPAPAKRTFDEPQFRPRNASSEEGQEDNPSTGKRKRRRRRRKPEGGPSPGGGGGGGGRRGQSHGQHSHGPSHGHGAATRGGHRSASSSSSSSRTRQPRVSEQNGTEITGTIEGVLELHPKGYGFLRDPSKNYAAQDSDSFVSSSLIEKHRLREGVLIRGDVGPGTRGQGPRLRNIETIDGRSLEEFQQVKHFEELTPINPHEIIRLETGPRPVTMRVMDLLTPIGKGQRALIVAPPRTGKTMLLHDIAHAVSVNHPEIYLMVLLIDERPEEVTELQRNVKGEVIASSMDRDVESHVRISQLIIERGKRIAEAGGEVFILLDSITRTARAFNKWVGNSGRTATGGLDIRALDIPKKLFGTARRFEEGGSLTVAATALIDTGSRMDEVIFQEFKGTGNMELVLSRDLADRRIWPAIDITRSGTRREEKLFDKETLDTITLLRRSLISLSPVEAMEQLTRKLDMFPSNAEFLRKVRNVL